MLKNKINFKRLEKKKLKKETKKKVNYNKKKFI